MPRGLMKGPVFEQVLQAIRRNRGRVKVVVLYHGGEPLLNPRFFDMVGRLKAADPALHVKTVTNGALLSPRAIRKLLQCGLDAIEISLDGASPEENQYIRRKSNTREIVSRIRQLAEMVKRSDSKKPDVYINTTQFIRGHRPPPARPARPPAWLTRRLAGTVTGIKTAFAIQWPGTSAGGEYEVIPAARRKKAARRCDHVMNTVTVCADGSVAPCCYDLTRRMILGHVLKQPLEKIWNNRAYRALRKAIRTGRPHALCAGCAVVGAAGYLLPLKGPKTVAADEPRPGH